MNTEYSSVDSRIQSYPSEWNTNFPVDFRSLAEAGFYSIKIEDYVKCFRCGGGLFSWEVSDDPWKEHAKYFPHCSFVKLNQSHQFIQECLSGVITEIMETDAVKQLIELNAFPTDVIKEVLQKRLEEGRGPFTSFAHLYDTISQWENPSEINQENDLTEEMSNISITALKAESETFTNSGNNQILCKICYDRDIAVVFIPCGHQMTCTRCALNLDNCPICRKDIRNFVRTYFS